MTNLERMRLAAANKPAVAGEKKTIILPPSKAEAKAKKDKKIIDKGQREILKKATDQIVDNILAQDKLNKGEVKTPPPPQQPRKAHKHRPLPLTPDERDQLFKRKHRLPHDSTFLVVYDAVAVLWKGALNVPGPTDGQGDRTWQNFTHSGPGLYRMLSELDDMYLATLKPAGEPAKEGEVSGAGTP